MQIVRVLKPFKRKDQLIEPGTFIEVPDDILPKLAGLVEVAHPPARETLTCGDCKHFERDTVNPLDGAGRCTAGKNPAYPWPNAPRQCGAHTIH